MNVQNTYVQSIEYLVNVYKQMHKTPGSRLSKPSAEGFECTSVQISDHIWEQPIVAIFGPAKTLFLIFLWSRAETLNFKIDLMGLNICLRSDLRLRLYCSSRGTTTGPALIFVATTLSAKLTPISYSRDFGH